MKVHTEGNDLIIRIPMVTTPGPSKSGKTLIVATTSGFQSTEALFGNKEIKVSLTAIVAKD